MSLSLEDLRESFEDFSDQLPDPRIEHNKLHRIEEILFLTLTVGKTIRGHWGIENSLHWILDISFRDNDSRIRRGNVPENIAVIKHMALNMLQKAKGKRDSIKQMRKAAGWDDSQLLTILTHIRTI